MAEATTAASAASEPPPPAHSPEPLAYSQPEPSAQRAVRRARAAVSAAAAAKAQAAQLRQAVKAALETPADSRTQEQTALLQTHAQLARKVRRIGVLALVCMG